MKKSFLFYLKPLLSLLKTNKIFYILCTFTVYNTFYGIFLIYLTSEIIHAIEGKNLQDLYFWIYVFSGSTLVFLFIKVFYDAVYSQFEREIGMKLVEKYFKKFILLDNTAVEKWGTGKINSILNSGINFASSILIQIIFTIVSFIGVIYTFILIFLKVPNLYYFLCFLGLFVLIICIFTISIKQFLKIRKQSKEYFTETDRKKVKMIMSKFEILQNKKEDEEIKKILEIYQKEAKLTWNGHVKKGYLFALSEGILKAFFLGFFLIIGTGVITGNYQMATFALFIWLIQKISENAWEIRRNIIGIVQGFVHWEKLVDIFDEIPAIKDTSKFQDFEFKTGKIELKNISFAYDDENFIFENFSLLLEGGKKYAFVGESGGGKSTMLKLLSAYIRPNSGKILIDKQDISEVSLSSFYKNIGYLSQKPSVFDGTIYENLVYSLHFTPSEEEIKNILQKAKCEFVYDFEKGLQTEIGEKGIRLSGGQKQRLAIAKIMFKNPKIILLDEATSALDSFNEEQISLALEHLFEGKTVIIIAHRLQTVKNADMIFFLENGKIIEKGNHEALYKQKGKYYKMIELQSGF